MGSRPGRRRWHAAPGHEAFDAAVRDLSAFVEQWPAAVRALITSRQPVEAFCDLLVGPSRGIKNVLTFA